MSIKYAQKELGIIEKACEAETDKKTQAEVNKVILDCIKNITLANEKTPGATDYILQILARLLHNKPISALTGNETEWDANGINKRCASVVKDSTGNIIDHDAYVVSEDGGLSWHHTDKFKLPSIEFPYIPPTIPAKIYIEYTDIFDLSKFENITNNPERILKLRNKVLISRKEREEQNEKQNIDS